MTIVKIEHPITFILHHAIVVTNNKRFSLGARFATDVLALPRNLLITARRTRVYVFIYLRRQALPSKWIPRRKTLPTPGFTPIKQRVGRFCALQSFCNTSRGYGERFKWRAQTSVNHAPARVKRGTSVSLYYKYYAIAKTLR